MRLRIYVPLIFFVLSFFVFEQTSAQNRASALATEWVMSDIVQSADSGTIIAGNPKTIKCDYGKAVVFNGKTDGVFLSKMPLTGLESFTIEVIFRPDLHGLYAQRFFHCGEVGRERVMIETRTTPKDWYLDAFIFAGKQYKTLIDSTLLHPLGSWYHIAFVVENGKLATYVNGSKELEGQIKMTPLRTGKTSIGVRQNKVCWFKGAIYKVKISPESLKPDNFMKY